MNKTFNNFLLSILAGLSISLGGLIFLLIPNNIIGALFFSTGLFLVLTRGYNLFTGKVAYLSDHNFLNYLYYLFVMWIGNLLGSLIVSFSVRYTSLYAKILDRITTININKLSQGHISAFILAFFCGIIIFLAVENFKTNQHEIGKYIGIFILIPLFIICGFEHCVANMFYFSLTNDNLLTKLLYLIIITLGNSTGSIVSNLIYKKICKYKQKENEK